VPQNSNPSSWRQYAERVNTRLILGTNTGCLPLSAFFCLELPAVPQRKRTVEESVTPIYRRRNKLAQGADLRKAIFDESAG
jgi:hypothetical protein